MDFDYYYNNVPGIGLTRNNLVYTSLISRDKKTFVKWYYNDTEYHRNKNEVVDPAKMKEKWNREVQFLQVMSTNYPDLIPRFDIDDNEKKIYLEIDGYDFWNQSGCDINNYNKIIPDWQEQMLNIINAHKILGLHKYSMHPSSYFVVNGKLKSINYFFTYSCTESFISVQDVESHIHSNRQKEIRKNLHRLGVEWDQPQPWAIMDRLCWESFRNNYPENFIERVINVI